MYIVMEIQLNNGVISTLTYQFTELNEAYAKYHAILSVAAVSNMEVHTAVILSETGAQIARGHFAHTVVPQPVVEPEEEGGDEND